MRNFILLGSSILFSLKINAFSPSVPSSLPAESKSMGNTIRTLNQVRQEKIPRLEQQDLQEKQYQEDQLREKKKWEEEKAIEDVDLESINTPK